MRSGSSGIGKIVMGRPICQGSVLLIAPPRRQTIFPALAVVFPAETGHLPEGRRVTGPARRVRPFHPGHTVSPGNRQGELVTPRLVLAVWLPGVLMVRF